MTEQPTTRDEAILGLLLKRGPASTLELAAQLEMSGWTVRRGLRRLNEYGYVFSPERGRHRITARGIAMLQPLPPHRDQAEPTTPLAPDDSPRQWGLGRWGRRRRE
jgi:DeoR/GlpR family transcriptional regulator of sugar metabolism